jgi:chromatin structure-remodeling complex subunit RSC1/2
MDVDVGRVSSGFDGQGDDHLGGERDAGSEEIVKQLEKGLPRWEGFGDAGWMDEADHVSSSYALSETFKVFNKLI